MTLCRVHSSIDTGSIVDHSNSRRVDSTRFLCGAKSRTMKRYVRRTMAAMPYGLGVMGNAVFRDLKYLAPL